VPSIVKIMIFFWYFVLKLLIDDVLAFNTQPEDIFNQFNYNTAAEMPPPLPTPPPNKN
jgi:hypothetical protein